jgi:hypothetical protein
VIDGTETGPIRRIVNVAGINFFINGIPGIFVVSYNAVFALKMLAIVRDQEESLLFLQSPGPEIFEIIR